MIHVVGDVHGNLQQLKLAIDKCPSGINEVALLGDVGFGFVDNSFIYEVFTQRPNKYFWVIQGNHDNADLMESGSNYQCVTTKTGIHRVKIDGVNTMMIPGAYSYDKNLRVPGLTWWDNEEMSGQQLESIESHLSSVKLILSHDGPLQQYLQFFIDTKMSRTNMALDKLYTHLLRMQKEVTWVHGHFHQSYVEIKNNVTLLGVTENGYMSVL